MSRRIIYLFTSLLLTSVISSEALSAISAIDLKEKSHSTFFKPVYLYISTHEYSLAKQQLEKLPEQLLSTAEASYLKGLISFRLGSNLAATKYLKSSSDLARKNNYSLRIELARLYIELGKPQQAKKILLDVLKNSTNLSFLVIASKEIQYLEGMVSAKEDPTQAIKYFKELENSNPDDYRIPRILSSLYIKTGSLSDAEEALYRSLRTAKQYQSEVLYLFVDLYVQRNNVDLALSFFKRYKQTSINNHYRLKSANKLIRYADELIKQDELALAERIMVIVLDENVNIGNAIRAIVFLYLQNNDFEKAQRILDKYTKEDVDKDIILSLYYQLYSATNNLDKAIDLFESQARKNSAFLQGNALSELLQLYRKKYRQHLQSLPSNEIAAVNYAHFLLNNSLTDTRVLALEFCRALVEKLPKSADANYVYAQSLAENQFNTNALIYLSRAIRLSPNEIPWLFRYADLLEKTENYGAAINLLSTLSRHNREEYRNLASDKIDFVRGKVFISQKQYDQALRVYVGLLKSHPGDKEILEQLAIVYLANGNILLAQRLTKQIELIESNTINKGMAIRNTASLVMTKQYGKAIVILESLAKQFDKDTEILYWLGYTYAQQKDYAKAITYIQKSHQLDPTNSKTANYVANLMILADRLDEAKQHYEHLMEATESNAEKQEYLHLSNIVEGKILLKSGNTELAIEHFTSMLGEYPDDVETQKAIVEIYKKNRDWLSAVAVYKNLIRNDSKNSTYLFDLAIQYEYLGDEPNKERLLLQILKDRPGSKHAELARGHFLNKGNKLIAKKEYSEAENLYERVLSVLPGDTEFSTQLSLAIVEQGKTDQAEQIYLEYLSKEPFNSELRTNLAKLYTRLDRTEDAANQYRRIIEHEKGNSLGRRAKANLTFLYGDKSNKMRDKIKSEEDIEEAVAFSQMLIGDSYYDQAYQVLLKAETISPNNAKVNYWLGTIYSAKRNYNLALTHIRKSIAANPYNMLLTSALARVLAQSGDLDGAISNYQKVLEHELPDEMRVTTEKLLGFVVGQKLLLQSRYEEALEHYIEMEKKSRDDPAIYARIANVHLKLQNLDTAERIMKKVVQDVPDSAASHLQLAEIYRLKGQEKAYKDELKQVLFLDPSGLGLRILNKLGIADGNKYLKDKKWAKANEAFDQVLQFSPNSKSALIGKAKALSEQGLLKEAMDLLLIVVDEDPANYRARLELAKLYVLKGNIDSATIELERILFTAKYSKEGQEALVNLKKIYRQYGADLEKAGKFASAVNFFKRIVDQDPSDIHAHLSLASIYQRTSDKKMLAIEHYLKVIELDAFNSRAYTNLGVVYEVLGRNTDAMEAFTNAVAFTQTTDNKLISTLVNGIRIQLVRNEFEKKNYDWSVAEMVEITKADPENVQYYLFLAIIYTTIEDLEKAIAALNEGVVNDPKNNVVRFRLANLYERTSEYELALAHYRAILRSKEDGPIFETALDRVPILDQLVRTFNFSMQYLVSRGKSTYRDTGQSYDNFSSTMLFNISARARPTKALNLSLTASPTYTTLHTSNNDSFAPFSFSFNGNYNSKNGYLNTAASYRRSEGLLTEDIRGRTYSANGAMGYRLKLPRFLDANDRRLPKTFELSGAAVYSETYDFSYTDAYNLSGKFTFISPLTTGGSWIASYGYALNIPKVENGSDYSYGAHQGSLIISKVLARRITGSLSLSGEYRSYFNYDTNYAYTMGTAKRRNYAHVNFGGRIEFKAHTKLNVFADISAFEARSTLGTGRFIYKNGEAVGFQSSAIGDSRSIAANLGMRFIF